MIDIIPPAAAAAVAVCCMGKYAKAIKSKGFNQNHHNNLTPVHERCVLHAAVKLAQFVALSVVG